MMKVQMNAAAIQRMSLTPSDSPPPEESCTDYDEESVLEDLVGRYYQRTVGTQQEGPVRGAQRSAEREAELRLTREVKWVWLLPKLFFCLHRY